MGLLLSVQQGRLGKVAFVVVCCLWEECGRMWNYFPDLQGICHVYSSLGRQPKIYLLQMSTDCHPRKKDQKVSTPLDGLVQK